MLHIISHVELANVELTLQFEYSNKFTTVLCA
jgi:hypothetical protein